MTTLLEIENLQVSFHVEDGVAESVRGVNLAINEGETIAVVGESGCGKSVTALSIMRLLPMPPAKFVSGSIRFRGRNLFDANEEEMRQTRGNDIAMVFQEPMTSLNPTLTVGDQIAESIILHQNKSRREARELTLEMLRKVAISSPYNRIDQYPHELSGGMKQRVMIAMAISCCPALLIADEPTTALDVTIQAQILDLLSSLRGDNAMALMLITHNLGIVAEYADRVAVMYAGKIVEEAKTIDIFDNPRHPYTRGLLNSLPQKGKRGHLESISGSVPNPIDLPQGCAFHPRCPDAFYRCNQEVPTFNILKKKGELHRSACLLDSEESS